MKSSRKFRAGSIAGILFVTAVMSFNAVLSGCSGSGANGTQSEIVQGRPVKVMEVTAADSREVRSFPGVVKAVRDIDLAFRVGGPLVSYDINVGQQVKKGDVIARIDPRDFDLRVRKLTADLKAARARLADAEKNFERQKNLLVESAASQSQYDKTKLLMETTRAGIESLMTDLAGAKNALADTRLTAPFDGVINRKYTENHETVAPGIPVISLLDVSAIEVSTAVPEDIVIQKSGFSEVYCSLDAYPDRKLDATLKEIGRQTDSANQSYPMRVTLDVPENMSIDPGMAAMVYLVMRNGGMADDGFYLPTAAVFADTDGGSCVWRIDPLSLQTKKVRVKTGELKGDRILVVSGLAPGDRLITAGARFLMEGQKIRILNKKEGAAS